MKNSLKIALLFLVLIGVGIALAVNKDRILGMLNSDKECTPYNMLVEKEKESIVIKWETKDKCTGIVKFGSDVEDLQYWLSSKLVDEKNTVEIDKDTYENINYFVIISNGELYGLDGKVVSIN